MEFLAQYNLTGIVIGIATFLIIGIFHPMVTKGEYYFGVKIWWLFLVMGIAAVAGSIAAHPLVDAAGRVGRLVAVVDRRTVRTARARGQRLVSEEPQAEIACAHAGYAC